MNTIEILNRIKEQKDIKERHKKFKKYKNSVIKGFPNATLKINTSGQYYIVDANGYRILQDEYCIPDCDTPFTTWEKTYNLLWSKKIIDRNNKKFSDERIINFSESKKIKNNI